MSKKTQSLNNKIIIQGKNTKKVSERKIIFEYLQSHAATNTMISVATGVKQKNICRIKRKLEIQGRLFETEKKRCKITNRLCHYLTTNKDLINKI